MKFAWFLSFLLATLPTASCQDLLKALPDCASTCLSSTLGNGICAPTNSTCLCLSQEFNALMSQCVGATCSVKEALATQNVTSILCEHPVRDRSTVTELTVSIFICLSIIVTIMRLSVKLSGKTSPFGWDDWTIFATVVIATACSALAITTARAGLGRDMWKLTPDQITSEFKQFYETAILYKFSTSLNKVSILFFYLRIFPSKPFRLAVYIWIALTCAVGLAFALGDALQCRPTSFFWTGWDGEHTGHCDNLVIITWVHSAINIFLDLGILILPLWEIRSLQLPLKKKIGVGLMFSVGSIVTIITILRCQSIVVLMHTQNPTWDFYRITIWSIAEIHVGILCACMPALRVLFATIVPAMRTTVNNTAWSQKYASQRTATHNADMNYSKSSLANLTDDEPYKQHHQYTVKLADINSKRPYDDTNKF